MPPEVKITPQGITHEHLNAALKALPKHLRDEYYAWRSATYQRDVKVNRSYTLTYQSPEFIHACLMKVTELTAKYQTAVSRFAG